MQRQLGALAGGIDLYLDLPVGVHRYGYDAWRDRASFADRVSVGAPPDALFTGGQNWGLPPLHPEHARRAGHAYFRACVAAHLEHAACCGSTTMGRTALLGPRGASAAGVPTSASRPTSCTPCSPGGRARC
jgi:hypothetical protein